MKFPRRFRTAVAAAMLPLAGCSVEGPTSLFYVADLGSIYCPQRVNVAQYEDPRRRDHVLFFTAGGQTPFAVYKLENQTVSLVDRNGKEERKSKRTVKDGEIQDFICKAALTAERTQI